MNMWYRVFGTNDNQGVPEAILANLHDLGCAVTADFHCDETGWVKAEITFAATTPVHVERFLSSEEGIRAELNTWAAYLETCDYSPNHTRLMEHMVQTRQLFTVRRPFDASDEILTEKICLGLSQFLSRTTAGVYQIDGQGFFTPEGLLLLQEY
jgi:hypothetical protein